MPIWLLAFILTAPQDQAYLEATQKMQDLDPQGAYEVLSRELSKATWNTEQKIHLHIELLTIAANFDPNLMADHAKQALSLARQTEDDNLIALALTGLADTFYMQGDYQTSLQHFQEAWQLVKNLGADQEQIINLTKSLGILYRATGDAGEALIHLELAKELAIEAGWHGQDICSIYQNLGQLYAALGDLQAAHDCYKASLALAVAEENQQTILGTLLRLGFLDLKTGAYQQALDRFEKSQDIYEKHQLLNSGWSLEGRIDALQKLGRDDEAIALIGDPVAIGKGEQSVARSDLLILVKIFRNRDLELAENFANKALELAGQHPISNLLAFEALATVALASEQKEEATIYLLKAIQALEQHAATMSNRRQQTNLRSQYQHIYQQTIHLLNERCMNENNQNLGYLSFHLLQQAKGWWRHDAAFLTQLLDLTPEVLLTKTWKGPNWIHQPGDVFVDMLVSEDVLWHFIVRGQELQILKAPHDPKTIFQNAAQLQSMIQHPSTSEDLLREQGLSLLNQLFPLAFFAQKPNRIFFSADGPIKNVPLAFLVALENPQIKVIHAPNFHTFQTLNQKDFKSKRALILAAPQLKKADPNNPNLRLLDREGFAWSSLPASKREAQFIAKNFTSDTFTGEHFNQNTLKTMDLSPFELIHFATHGFFSARDPLRSALLSTPKEGSGLIEVEDIRSLNLHSKLVVLSACQTAKGGNINQDVHQPMLDAFIEAGSSSVLGSLWTVEDQASQLFMQFFYQALAEGQSSDIALQRAQLRMQKDGWSPYYWAGFILYGTPQTIEGAAQFSRENIAWVLVAMLLIIWTIYFQKYRTFRGRLRGSH